jgi:diguanylate cyclase (GGDEF)-like protein
VNIRMLKSDNVTGKGLKVVNLLLGLEKQSRTIKILLGAVLIGVIGAADFLAGYELSLSVFYVLPILGVTWLVDKNSGIIASLASACVWFVADVASGHPYSHPFIPIWNALIRLSFFLIITLLLSTLRSAMDREKELSGRDSLTGAANSRLFFDIAEIEINRIRRYEHPLTLVYLDIDNFKYVNDRFGHPAGDRVLRAVAIYAREHSRQTDVVARLGGDEFALLMPEMNQKSARVVISKLRYGLLEEMRQNDWPVTFSIGVLTCSAAPPTTEELVRMADDLMYSVKRTGKNALRYSIYAG